MQTRYDLVIVGAGMVGATFACLLEKARPKRGGSILLVEAAAVQAAEAASQPGFDARSTVLSHTTAGCFRQLGLWQELEPCAAAIRHIHVSDQGRFGAARLSARELNVPALGYVLENQVLGKAINAALRAAQRIELRSPAQVEGLEPLPSGMMVQLSHGKRRTRIEAELVVLAEGGRSGLCDDLGICRRERSYGQQAIISNVACSAAHGNWAFERFTEKGPLALLPLRDFAGEHRAALIWTQREDEAEAVMALPEAQFLEKLQDEAGGRLGRFTRAGRRFAYPLSLVEAEEQARPGLALLGNAAHSLHPVAGQGFNLACRDAMRLAQTILRAWEAGENPGAMTTLRRYLASARDDQRRTTLFSHYLTRLFSTGNGGLAWARKFGMFSIDLPGPLKTAFARHAMGQAGALPVK